MSQILLEALGLSIPVAVLAFLAAWVIERMGANLRLRLCAWTAALLLPAAPIPAMLAIHALGVPSPFAAMEPAPTRVVELVIAVGDAAPAPAPAPQPKPAPPLPIAALLLGLAAAGAALRLGQLALGLRRVARLKAASEAIPDPELAARLGQGVRLADTQTPVLAGLKRPTILLPRRLLDGLSPEQAALVCAHERAHLAAGDHLSHLMEETMVRAFWFNPVMAAARERLAAAREEACDARALEGCDASRRRAYAQTLIAALRLAGPAEPVAAFTGFRRRGAERRLKAILRGGTGAGSWRALAAAVLASAGLTALVGGVSLAAAAEPPGPVASQPLPPPPAPPAPPATRSVADVVVPPAAPAPPAPPAPGAKPGHYRSVIVTSTDVDRDGKPHRGPKGEHTRTMYFDGDRWVDSDVDQLTPEQRAKVEAAMQQAREAMERARADSHDAIEKARVESREAMEKAQAAMAKVRVLSAEEREKVRKQVDEAMKQAGVTRRQVFRAWAENDGRELMRCKVGADGKATDCVKAFPGPGPGPVYQFELRRMGPDGKPLPPMQGVAPFPPEPPPPPAPGNG